MLSEYSKELQILPPNMIVQILVVFEIRRLLWLFEKVFMNFIWLFFPKFPTLYLVPVRVLSKVANLACKYDCSKFCSFRDVTFFVVFFKVFRKLIINFFAKSEIPNSVVGYCQSTIKDCESCLQIWLLNYL